ncbi:MAG: ABC transporter ATP-binding protein, partial [Oscillospiraceae bacterium]|nr:ABC transporter ATP-binding protein [Oscillospiraceae bacterium]
IKVFTHEKEVIENFEPINEELRKASTTATIATSVVGPLLNNLSHMFYALTCAIGVLWLTGEQVGGILIAFLQYIRTFADRVSQISEQFNSIMLALAGAERIFDVLDMEPEVDEGKVTLEHSGNDYNWVLPDGKRVPLRGDVRFNNVDFAYVEGKPVLHDLSLFAKPGQKIAFVGSTGAGKTTITNLINRFYDIQGGEIIYDGINVRDIRKDDLRRSLGIVLQDTHLFTGTVMENIRYGRLDATDEDCIRAAKIANAHYFISHLPQGYDTMLHSDGANLSQGQRQLLAIARAAVSEAPVMILDEATSSVDTRTEKLIEKGLDGLMEGRTVFIIAHRLSTVRNSNAILVLEQGKVVERGDHDDLLEQKGKYYQLYTNMIELS